MSVRRGPIRKQSIVSIGYPAPSGRKIFHFIMIKPSHYDDDGYVIQWVRSLIPSNSLAAIYAESRGADAWTLGRFNSVNISAKRLKNLSLRQMRVNGSSPSSSAFWTPRYLLFGVYRAY